jgi:multidrug resistance protein MdtO
MATAATAPSSAIDQGAEWFWDFLKKELTPYPGRLWVVARMTISATLVMILIEVFRIPGGFQGAIFTLLLSRENPTETFRSGLRTLVAYFIGTAYVIFTIRMMVDDPLTHFLWVAGSLFLFFYLLRVITDYGSAVPMGFAVMGAISLWDDNTINVNDRLENTLWLAGAVSLAVVVSITVEYVFRRVHPATDLTEGIENRLQIVEKVLRAAAEEKPLDSESEKRLALYSSVGTSRLRRLIVRSDYSSHFKSQMGAAISLLGRLVDTGASFRLALMQRAAAGKATIGDADRERLHKLADQVAEFAWDLPLRKLPQQVDLAGNPEPSSLPLLPSMEQTAALIPQAFSGSDTMNVYVPAPLAEEGPKPMFASDAFSNSAYVVFAMRGTLAAMACYILYTALDWPGISTSVVTCYITALSTIGSSRQKQVLRLAGAVIGGFIFGMGAQIFVLPHFETLTGFTVVFAVVTAIAAWIQTASARLSYLGVQLALAYYLIHLQEFTIQTSLAIARDRVVGVLLGLVSMGLFFDLLWVRKAVDEMQVVFAHNLEMFAELTEQLLEEDQIKAIKRIRSLRDQLNAGFEAVRAQADAVLLEFGPSRRRKLEIREDIRRWSPAIRTLLQVQITSAQYLTQRPLKELPAPIAEAGIAFEKDIAHVMRAMANEVSGKAAQPVSDLRTSADRFGQAAHDYYSGASLPVPPQASDVAGLARSLANILAPLYDDIHTTFAGHKESVIDGGGYIPSEARS